MKHIHRLRNGIQQIDEAVSAGRATGYRICSVEDPGSPLAQFWGLDNGGNQRFGTFKNLLVLVVFPSEKLARRCLDMTGGYVISMAHLLASHRKAMEARLKSLQQPEKKRKGDE